MSVSKKSDFHTAPQNYQDVDGMKTFTVIDHDVKSKMYGKVSMKIDEYNEFLKQYRKELIERILAIPAVFCPEPFQSFVIRNADSPTIQWNEVMLRDEGVTQDNLRNLCIMLENSI